MLYNEVVELAKVGERLTPVERAPPEPTKNPAPMEPPSNNKSATTASQRKCRAVSAVELTNSYHMQMTTFHRSVKLHKPVSITALLERLDIQPISGIEIVISHSSIPSASLRCVSSRVAMIKFRRAGRGVIVASASETFLVMICDGQLARHSERGCCRVRSMCLQVTGIWFYRVKKGFA